MFRSACCALALSLTLGGCGEPADLVSRKGKFVKTCPNLRIFYQWQGKLYLKDRSGYHEVEGASGDLCDQIANSQLRYRTVESSAADIATTRSSIAAYRWIMSVD
jgi:hypothetical protein